jgi:hypothetical protein
MFQVDRAATDHHLCRQTEHTPDKPGGCRLVWEHAGPGPDDAALQQKVNALVEDEEATRQRETELYAQLQKVAGPLVNELALLHQAKAARSRRLSR